MVLVGLTAGIALILAWGAGMAVWTSVVIAASVVGLAAILAAGERLRTWWSMNLLRNNLDAKRRLKRERGGDGEDNGSRAT